MKYCHTATARPPIFRKGLIVFFSLLAVSLSLFFTPSVQAQNVPVLKQPAPPFTLPDVDGKPHSLKEFAGRPLVLFFYCGCAPCHAVAQLWAQAQRSGALKPVPMPAKLGRKKRSLPEPRTAVIYTGEADGARQFAAETGLSARAVTLLTDPELTTAQQYNAIVCPRVFVLDGKGILRYTNAEKGADPQKTPAAVLVSRTLTALNKLNEEGNRPSASSPHKTSTHR